MYPRSSALMQRRRERADARWQQLVVQVREVVRQRREHRHHPTAAYWVAVHALP
jgi:hypothetical protein